MPESLNVFALTVKGYGNMKQKFFGLNKQVDMFLSKLFHFLNHLMPCLYVPTFAVTIHRKGLVILCVDLNLHRHSFDRMD